MSIFKVDYTSLEELDNKTYKFSDVKDKIIRVAADVVRFRDAPVDELWEIISGEGDDGDYIVARYNTDDELALKTANASTKSPWEALVKEGSNEVHLFYKGVSFTKFAHKEASTIKNFLPAKLSTDKSLLNALIAALSPAHQEEVQKLYPELF